MIGYVVLSPSDFYLFLKLKRHKVSDDKNAICTTNGWLKDQEQQFFHNRIRVLEKPWTKCISVAENMSKSDKI